MGTTTLPAVNDAPKPGTIARQGFGESEVQALAETSSTALAEREKATVQALFIVAMQRPRSLARFEQNLIHECERPGFAECARYKKPQRHRNDKGQWEDGFIEGWSIRFAEAAMRNFGNVFCDSKIVYEDEIKRIIRFMVIDLENNIPLSAELQLSKTVERRGYMNKGKLEPPSGRDVIGQRENTKGDTVFTVSATEDELGMKQAAAWSKFIRNVLRFMPGDVLDACEVQLRKTLKGLSKEAAVERIVAAFDSQKVALVDLQMYLGHTLSTINDEELQELRGVFTVLKEGDTTWQEILDAKQPAGSIDAAAKIAEQKITEAKAKAAESPFTTTQQSHGASQPQPGDEGQEENVTGQESSPKSATPIDGAAPKDKPKFGFPSGRGK